MPRTRVRKTEKKRKRATVKTEPLADGAGASSAAGVGRARARAEIGAVSGSGAPPCVPPPAKRARVTVKQERKARAKKEEVKGQGQGKVEVNSEDKDRVEEELAFDLAPPRRTGGEREEPLGPPRYGPGGQKRWDGVSRWMRFSSCRAFARSLGLKSVKEWEAWRKVPGQRPEDVPSTPDRVYAGYGWQGYGDFLGTGNVVGNKRKSFKSFAEARAFARGLKLSGTRAWQAWSKHHRPNDIPSNPHQVYKDAGWINWKDFLGTGNKRGMQPSSKR